MTDIKIKRYADKENLKKLVKYSKDTFANKSEINENYYTKSEIDTKLTSKANTNDLATVATSGSYNDLLDKPTSFDDDLSNYYTKSEVDNLLRNIGSGTEGGDDAQSILKRWPDGAEAHNAIWGGRDITAAFDSGEFSEHVEDGTFKDIFPGDYITKQVTIPQVLANDGTTLFDGDTFTIDWVIADCNYWNRIDNHVAIVPRVHIFSAQMNLTDTTEGGYAGSEMYKNVIPACATGIVNAFGSDHILTFHDIISNSVDTSHVSSGLPQLVGTPGWPGEWVSVQCNLMSEKMVYGAPIFSAGAMDNVMAIRQMSAFRLSSGLIIHPIWERPWWLRDVVSSSHFACVYGYPGVATYADANGASSDSSGNTDPPGVRPFTLLR